MTTICSNELHHHGILGQKWGVRRFQNKDGSLTAAGRKRYNRDGDTILPKGTTFARVVTSESNNRTKNLYVTYRVEDRDKYVSILGVDRASYLKNSGKIPVVCLKEMTTKRDIKIPSRQTQVDAFKKLYTNNPDGVQSLLSEYAEDNGLSKSWAHIKNTSRGMEKAYDKFNCAIALGSRSKNRDLITAYTRDLMKKGYNAIPDINDLKFSNFLKANAPIILFNGSKAVVDTTIRELTPGEIFESYTRNSPDTISSEIRNLVPRKAKLSTSSDEEYESYMKQLAKDAVALNENYTLSNLLDDLDESNYVTSRFVRRVNRTSKNMDAGYDYETAKKTLIGRLLVKHVTGG